MSLTTSEIAALFADLMAAPAHLNPNEYPAVARLHSEVVDFDEKGLTTLPRGWVIKTLLDGSEYGPLAGQSYFDDWVHYLGSNTDTDAEEFDDFIIGWAMSIDEAMGYYEELDNVSQMNVLNMLNLVK